jgi:hypothetical protein
MNDKDPFLQSLTTALDESSNTDLNIFLFSFRKDLTASQFKKYSAADRLDVICEVWKFLRTTAGNSSSSIRHALSVRRALSSLA